MCYISGSDSWTCESDLEAMHHQQRAGTMRRAEQVRSILPLRATNRPKLRRKEDGKDPSKEYEAAFCFCQDGTCPSIGGIRPNSRSIYRLYLYPHRSNITTVHTLNSPTRRSSVYRIDKAETDSFRQANTPTHTPAFHIPPSTETRHLSPRERGIKQDTNQRQKKGRRTPRRSALGPADNKERIALE